METSNRAQRRRNLWQCTILTLAAAALFAGAAAARTVHDGDWSVTIWTERGHCDRGYKYPIRVSAGAVRLRGTGPAEISGEVNERGAVRVLVSAGEQHAEGTGRLGDDYGEGTWRGRSAAGECSGVWEAERE
jgi:hypothetical protein